MKQYSQPTLIINEQIARANIKKMAEKARRNNVAFIPHFKTHQSKNVGEWFREEGVEAITVASVSMAKYFAGNNWTNITIAFPINLLEINELNTLAESTQLTLLVQDDLVVKSLESIKKNVDLYIEIDAGYHRSGVAVENLQEIERLLETIKDGRHQFKGFYYHAGNSYKAKGQEEIKEVYDDMKSKLAKLKAYFKEFNPHIAIGDTPICSIMNDFKEFDSIHPGNFVYYDATQIEIGSCELKNVATFMSCPVVATYKNRNEWVIYGGGVHLSKEGLETKSSKIFGLVGRLEGNGSFNPFPDVFISSLSQEHGIISSNKPLPNTIKASDVVHVLPIHSCMTVDCMPYARTMDGDLISKMNK